MNTLKVAINKEKNEVQFCSLRPNQVFMHNKHVYLKVYHNTTRQVYGVRFTRDEICEDGRLVLFGDTVEVVPVNATLTVEA